MVTNETLMINESCMGYCSDCERVHSLPLGNTAAYARKVMDEFRGVRRLDYLAAEEKADPRLSFDYLFPGVRGHMFGVLECVDRSGKQVMLRAFSSLRDGVRWVDGWVPPIHSDEVWETLILPTQTKIKAFTGKMKSEDPKSAVYAELFEERKKISQNLVASLQDELFFTNFRGCQRGLKDVYYGSSKIPGGVGDCCGPKLLNYAALNHLKPLGLSEFYWGEPTPSGSKVQGEFYPCCKEKCQPILGFMLCGIDELS